VLAVIKTNVTVSQQAGFAMPATGASRGSSDVRALWVGGVSAIIAGPRRNEFVAPVCAHKATTDVYVLKGAFPGISAWSPPI
jgi:hypothetical protein